jgi:MraZ protein
MFHGRSALTLDGKGRMSIPARHRDALAESAERAVVTITQHPNGCLVMYPQSKWVVEREKIAQYPDSRRWLRRLVLGSAVDAEIDASGRVLIAPELRQAVGLVRDVMLIGMGDEFEIWDVGTLLVKEKEDRAKALASEEDYSA